MALNNIKGQSYRRWGFKLGATFFIVLYSVVLAAEMTATTPGYLPQGWTHSERQWFHYANQGSQLIPYPIFLHLEQAGKPELFRDPEHMQGFAYLRGARNHFNPDDLPVGFTRDAGYLGLTCAACHTGEVRVNGEQIFIDGGQGNGDLQKLLRELDRALQATELDEAKKGRLLARLNSSHGLDQIAAQSLLEEASTKITELTSRNNTSLHYGFSRLDAFGAILNKGLALTGVANNRNEPKAPTSYPYIWDTPQHDWVEWNGSSSNPVDGALARNVGEVIGVFGHIDTSPAKWLGLVDAGYRSSIKTRTLRRIEKLVRELKSPRWQDAGLPAVEPQQAKRGKAYYAEYCGACHLDINRDDEQRKIQVRMSSLAAVGSDPATALSAVELMGASGAFQGGKRFYIAGDELGETAPSLYIVNHVMGGVILNNIFQTVLSRRDAKSFGHGDERHPVKYLDGEPMKRGTETSEKALLAYKARPLNGIWASPPYLHNGSVPNMYELMLPAEERSVIFQLGDWVYDEKNMGYQTTITNHASEHVFEFDTRVPGNSNAGHEWGTGKDGRPRLSHEQILAVIEYIKTL